MTSATAPSASAAWPRRSSSRGWRCPPSPASSACLRPTLLCLAALLPLACQGSTRERAAALFQIRSAVDTDLFALPFPSDLRRGEDGTLDLGHLSRGQPELLQPWLDVIARAHRGFSRNAGVFFRFSQPIDPGCLPSPAASVQPGSAVLWVNLEQGSPAYGQLTPVRSRFQAPAGRTIGANSLSLLPVPGFTLESNSRYAVILTEALCDEHGDAVQPAPDFVPLLAEAPPAEPALARAHRLFQPLRAYLRDRSLSGVVAATIFTTGSFTEIPERARRLLHHLPPPAAENLAITAETERYFLIEGTYRALNFQQGSPPFMQLQDGGEIRLDESGDPFPAGVEQLRFAFTVPKGAPPAAGWPLVIYAHGTGGDYRTFVRSGVADVLSRVTDDAGREIASLAVVSIDQNLHGTRGSGSSELAFYNFQNPASFVYNPVQSAIDDFTLLRVMGELRLRTLPWSQTSGRRGQVTFTPPLRLDRERLSFMGHSQGSYTGSLFIAHEPLVRGGVLSGAGGGVIPFLLERTQPLNLRTLLELALGEALDEFHPVLSLFQLANEPAEPLNHARQLITHRASGLSPKHLFIVQGFVDHFVPNSTADALATAIGLPLLGPTVRPTPGLELLGLAPRPLPAAGNLTAGEHAVSGGMIQYPPVPTGERCTAVSDCCQQVVCQQDHVYCAGGECLFDGHFAVRYHPDAVRHYSRFLATLARDGTPLLGP